MFCLFSNILLKKFLNYLNAILFKSFLIQSDGMYSRIYGHLFYLSKYIKLTFQCFTFCQRGLKKNIRFLLCRRNCTGVHKSTYISQTCIKIILVTKIRKMYNNWYKEIVTRISYETLRHAHSFSYFEREIIWSERGKHFLPDIL